MATVIDDLLITLGFDADPSGADKFSASLNNVLGTVGKFGAVMGAAGAAAAAFIGKSLTDTASQFEQYNLQLETLTGSSQKAKEALDWITEFGKTTPYDINEITEGFIKLQAYGVDATDGIMTSLGDAAGALGGNMIANIEALADAQMGQNERLINAFNIKASDAGDEWRYIYQNLKTGQQEYVTASKDDANAIKNAIQSILDNNYGGGMEKLSGSWAGIMGNMGDLWTGFKKSITDRGLFDRAKSVLIRFADFVEKNQERIDAVAQSIGEFLIVAFDKLSSMTASAVKLISDIRDSVVKLDEKFGIFSKTGKVFAFVMSLIIANFVGLMALKIIAFVTSLARAFLLLFSPLALIGVALIALGLIVQDIYSYFNGGGSIFGEFLEEYPAVAAAINFLADNLGLVAWIVGSIIVAIVAMKAVAIASFIATGIAAVAAYVAIGLAAVGAAIAAAAAWVIAFAPFFLLALLVVGLITVFYMLYKNWTEIWTNIKKAASDAMESMFKAFQPIVDAIKWMLGIDKTIEIDADSNQTATRTIVDEGKANADLIKNRGSSAQTSGVSSIVDIAMKAKNENANNGYAARDYAKNRASTAINTNQSTVTQTINVASASEAAVVANRTATGSRYQSNGYQ